MVCSIWEAYYTSYHDILCRFCEQLEKLETDVQLERTYKDKANLENLLASCQERKSLWQRMMEEEEVHQVN
jgi:hypothetical protein